MERNIFIEVKPIGNMVSVIAIDEETGKEISFIAPRNTPALSLKMMAQKKIEYVLNKNQS
ncbi:MAG: hypothetical protein MJ247_04695 [Alphaproteobacteria bacterium]|nr:hypothetical protein [Alphaproteobacteria bacterium]